MRPIKVLTRLGLLSWNTLILGWKNSWVSKHDIIQYAASMLSNENSLGNKKIALIAGSDCLEEEEFANLLSELLVDDRDDRDDELNKWRLAHLICINESSMTEQSKIDELQEVYAKFDYPEDMISCSIYAQDEIDPLMEMNRVIINLMDSFDL